VVEKFGEIDEELGRLYQTRGDWTLVRDRTPVGAG
jgi:hypothetical protein